MHTRHAVKTAKHIIKLFLPSGSHTILSIPIANVTAIFRRDLPNGASNAGGDFFTNISRYLGNDARDGRSYYRMRIGNCTQVFEW